MDKSPDKEQNIEYVDAEPIEGSGSGVPQDDYDGNHPYLRPSRSGDGQPHVYSYYQTSRGCTPCCGPIGCGIMIAVILMMLGQPELLKGVLLAMGIMVLVSLLSQVFLTRR